MRCKGMRTTVTFDGDVAAAIEQIRRERGVGSGADVTHQSRLGMAAQSFFV